MGFMKDGGSPTKKISKKENTMYKKMLMDLINKTSVSSTKGLNSVVKKAPGGTIFNIPDSFTYGDIKS